MRTDVIAIATAALAACGPVRPAQPAPGATAPAGQALGDLAAMTFGCPKAALNAAAREAAKVSSQGTYQFAYFSILNDSHHSSYEVHFRSNYEGEPDLRYCVSMYCQQGWDPESTETSVTRMGDAGRRAGSLSAEPACGNEPAHAKHR
jgi:hypothetical protein